MPRARGQPYDIPGARLGGRAVQRGGDIRVTRAPTGLRLARSAFLGLRGLGFVGEFRERLSLSGNIIETGIDSYRLATTRARAEQQSSG